jgi:replicative DNA helicase
MSKEKWDRKKDRPINANEYGKLPPQAVELEEAILAACITNSKCCDTALSILTSSCFYKIAHQSIFEAIQQMAQQEIPIETITLIHHLRKTDKIDEVGGPYYITVLVNKLTSTVNCEFHCYVVFEMFVKREMIRLFTEETITLYSDNSDIYDVYNRVEQRLEEIFDTLTDNQVKHMKASIDKTIHEITAFNDGTEVNFLKTGIRLFDEHIFLSPKMVLGIAASRGAGKTRYLIYLMKQILNNNDNVSALWYSMEDSDTKIIRCFAATNTGLSDSQMQSKNYKLSEHQISALTTEINKFSKYDIDFVNDQENMATISRTFNRFVKKRPDKICLLLIDNIMLIDDLYNLKGESQLSVEDRIAASLRKIVNKAEKNGHKVIIIFLHHMTKEMESKYNIEEAYRPRLVHLKGSSRFADVANAIVLINKPGMHKDLIKKHSVLPDILCVNSDGSKIYVKRELLLQKMMIVEAAKNRDGDIEDGNAIQRYVADLDVMKFTELNCIK